MTTEEFRLQIPYKKPLSRNRQKKSQRMRPFSSGQQKRFPTETVLGIAPAA